MRGELIVDRIPTKMVNNRVLVGVDDTFTSFVSKGGIIMVNLTEDETWGDSEHYNISEFIMRYGKVMAVPEKITKGSFNYDTEVELQVGDTVFWNLISFSNHIPLVKDKRLMLLVDYHEIIARKRDEEIIPINGFGLFTPVAKDKIIFQHVTTQKITDEWILDTKPERKVKYAPLVRSDAGIWFVGDKVKLLVGSSPYKLEGNINHIEDHNLYACPMSYIICTV